MKDSHLPGRRVDVSVDIDADAVDLIEAFADPEKLAGWFVDRAEGRARAPGDVMTWIFESFNMKMPYRVVNIVPGEKIVFGPGDDSSPPFLLEINIQRHGGQSRVRLINSGFSDDADFDAQFEGIDSGWKMALGILKEYAENYYGLTRTGFLVMEPSELDFETIRSWFLEPERLCLWLGEGDINADPGGMSSVDIEDLGSLKGRTLAVTPSEVAVSWPEQSAALELKAWAGGPSRFLGIRGMKWGESGVAIGELETAMRTALAKLTAALRSRAATP